MKSNVKSHPQSILDSAVAVSRDTIRKVSNVLASGTRLLRQLEQAGDEAAQQAAAKRREKLCGKLLPLITLAEQQLAEVRDAAGDAHIELSKLLALRGRVGLPNFVGCDADSAWSVLATAYSLVTDGIANYEMKLREAKAMVNIINVTERELQIGGELAWELGHVRDFGF